MEVVGINELTKTLDKLSDDELIKEALISACALVESSAKENAPKGTGALRRSIQYEIQGNKGIVFTPLLYAPYVEYGTGLFAEKGGREDVPWRYQDDEGNWHTTFGMPPQPYMRPALNENREQILKLLNDAIEEAIK